MYFEIPRNSSQVGLFERRGPNDYHFVRERSDIRTDHLYYLYFRDKPDKSLIYLPESPSMQEQEKV